MWIERDTEGDGNMLHDHKRNQIRQRKYISAHKFLLCLLAEEWESSQAGQRLSELAGPATADAAPAAVTSP